MKGDRDPVETLSKRLFNSEHRLTVVRGLFELDRAASSREIEDLTGVPRSTVHDELNLLADVGLLVRAQPDRTVFYQRADGPFWDWCRQLLGAGHYDEYDGD